MVVLKLFFESAVNDSDITAQDPSIRSRTAHKSPFSIQRIVGDIEWGIDVVRAVLIVIKRKPLAGFLWIMIECPSSRERADIGMLGGDGMFFYTIQCAKIGIGYPPPQFLYGDKPTLLVKTFNFLDGSDRPVHLLPCFVNSLECPCFEVSSVVLFVPKQLLFVGDGFELFGIKRGVLGDLAHISYLPLWHPVYRTIGSLGFDDGVLCHPKRVE